MSRSLILIVYGELQFRLIWRWRISVRVFWPLLAGYMIFITFRIHVWFMFCLYFSSDHGFDKFVCAKYATAQQIINKNNEAWRSFLKLKKLEKKGKLPPHIKKVSMPGYWKRNGKRELRVIIRNDCYRLDDKYIYLPKRLKLRYWGRLKWNGKQGRLEIIYDEVDEVWRVGEEVLKLLHSR
ncbi:MAG: hypothetical protein DRZ80_06780 [Thermoprotei archaeon]|nr:MAG: hypothetical protein DRZ80_06780 [Thermoprotei archaeon]